MGRGEYRSHSVTNLFREASIEKLIQVAVCGRNQSPIHEDLAGYQIAQMMRALAPLKVDFFSASFVSTNADGHPFNVQCGLWNLPAAIIDNYVTVAEHDVFAPHVYESTGRVVAHEELFTQSEWYELPFFKLHLKRYGIHGALMINLRLPGKELTHITMEYLFAENNLTYRTPSKLMLELATLPFALAWFYRFGALDEPVFRRRMESLVNLTTTNLVLLRKFVSSPHEDLTQQAETLHMSPAAYKQSLYQLRDQLISRNELLEPTTTRASLRQIDQSYQFLNMLGDPTHTTSPLS